VLLNLFDAVRSLTGLAGSKACWTSLRNVILQIFGGYCLQTAPAASRTRSLNHALDPAGVIEIKNATEGIVEGACEVAPSLRGETLDERAKVMFDRLQLQV